MKILFSLQIYVVLKSVALPNYINTNEYELEQISGNYCIFQLLLKLFFNQSVLI